MNEFYKQSQQVSSGVVEAKWKNCVLEAAQAGRSLFEAKCDFSFRPDDAAIKALETSQIKLQVDYIESWTYDPDGNTPQHNYTQPQYYPAVWRVTVKQQ